MNIDAMAKAAFDNARAHGFHDRDRTVGEDAALLHSEVSEFFEAFRDGEFDVRYNPFKGDKPEGLMSELADLVIRAGDTAERLRRAGIVSQTLGEAIVEKMAYNKTRPPKHGGKNV